MTQVPNTYTFTLRDVVTSINSEQSQKVVNGLRDAFMYSKSPQFDHSYGIDYIHNVPPKHMRQFRNYHAQTNVMRIPGSEIATSNSGTNIAMFPNDNVGYADTSGLTGVIDAQYSTDGHWLYAITSNKIYVFEASLQRAGIGSFNWDMGTLLYTLSGSEIFSTRIFVSPYGDFIGGSQGSFVICIDGAFGSVVSLTSSPIVGIERTFQQNGTVFDPFIWFLTPTGVLYYNQIHLGAWSAWQSWVIPLMTGTCTEIVYTGQTVFANNTLNNSHSSGMFIKCGGDIYFVDPFASSSVGPTYQVYKFSQGFNYVVPGYNSRVIHIDNYGKLISWGSPSNLDYKTDTNVIQAGGAYGSNTPIVWLEAYVTSMPVTVTGGVTTNYTGWVVLGLFWAPANYGGYNKYVPEFTLIGFIDKQINKTINDFIMWVDGTISVSNRFATIRSTISKSIVNPISAGIYFAAKLTNNVKYWNYPYMGNRVGVITLSNSALSATLIMETNYSNYRVIVDASGHDWFTILGTDEWERNTGTFPFSVTTNTTGKVRFTWIHMLDGDTGIIIDSLPITQNA